MKKILFLILASIGYLSTFSVTHALSYNSSAIESPPSYTFGSSIPSYLVGVTTGGSFSQVTGSSPSYLNYLPNFPIYYVSNSSNSTAVYDTNVLLDFSGVTFTGQYLISKLYFYDTGIFTRWYLSGTTQIIYDVQYITDPNTSIGTTIYMAVFNLATPINSPTGGYDTKKVALAFEELYYSDNGVFSDNTYLSSITISRFGSDGRSVDVDINPDINLSNSYSYLSACGMIPGSKSVNTANCHYDLGSIPFFPNAKYYKFNDQTSNISSNSGSTLYHINGISNFYTSTGVTFNLTGSTSSPTSGSGESIFGSCSTLDIPCYFGIGVEYLANTPERLLSSIIPDISFTGNSNDCLSGSTSGFGSGITEISYFQKVANLFALVIPLPPTEGSMICTFDGLQPMEYRRVYSGDMFEKTITNTPDTFNGFDSLLLFTFSLLAALYLYQLTHKTDD